MNRAGALARACHPAPTVAVTAFTTVLAAAAGRAGAGVVLVALTALSGQLSVGWSNDYLDRDRDARTGRADKPVGRGEVGPRTVGTAAVVALVACVPLSFASGWRAAAVHLVAVALAWAYNLGLKGTVLSVLPYTVAFGVLGAFVVLGLPGHPAPPWWLLLGGALLGTGAHFANVLPDLADDARTGVRGLPHRFGGTVSRQLSAVLLVAASLVVAFGPGRPGAAQLTGLGLVVVIVVAGIVSRLRVPGPAGERLAFTATLVVAGVDVVMLVVAAPSFS